ncbi:MAG: ATP-binding protein, partial [bacterium]|nr:ATP-binding protein [bacterium]
QIFEERTTQLIEITTQVRANLGSALDTHWDHLTESVNALEEGTFEDGAAVSAYVGSLEELFEMESYHSDLMLLDSQGDCWDETGSHGIWADLDLISDGGERYSFISESYASSDSCWIFVQKLKNPLKTADGLTFTHAVLLRDIYTLIRYYDSEAYGGQNETYILKSNGTRMHDSLSDQNTIEAYNVLKVLEEMEGQQYQDIRAALAKEPTISTNFRMDGREYYYCITSLEEYDTLLLFLIPAEYVASGTVAMVNTVVRTLLSLGIVMLLLIALAVAAVLRQRASTRLYLEEQENLRRQEVLNQQLEEYNVLLTQAKESAEQAFQIAEEANRAKSSFLSNMSHDIRTPMNAIVGFATLLERDAEKPEKVREYTKKITASSQHLLGLINDILDISKIEAGKTTLNLTDENMEEVIENIDSIIRPQMKAKGHTFRVTAENLEHNYVVMDKLRLNQILLNLLSNAMKYTPDGGLVKLTVQELPQHSEKFAAYRFIVADNGYGMSEEYQRTIFQAFTREEDSMTNKIQGTGLGMAITKNLIDLMGGTIDLKSKKGEGSTFTVELKLQISEQSVQKKAEAERQGTAQEDAAQQSILSGKHILAAEDNEINAEILGELLSIVGATCEICENGQIAVERFKGSAPGTYQLILMDVQMPVMNGYEATKAIRALDHPLAKTIPIIAMTANAFAEDVRDALEAGMDAHVAKPVDMDMLEQEVRKVIREKS